MSIFKWVAQFFTLSTVASLAYTAQDMAVEYYTEAGGENTGRVRLYVTTGVVIILGGIAHCILNAIFGGTE